MLAESLRPRMLGRAPSAEISVSSSRVSGMLAHRDVRHLMARRATEGSRRARPARRCLPTSDDPPLHGGSHAPLHDAAVHDTQHAPLPAPSTSQQQQQQQPSSHQKTWAKRQRFLKREPGEVDDVIEINCGGEIMLTSRSTLTLVPGSRLNDMFTRRGTAADDQSVRRDLRGQVFLDYDPYCFGQVLRFLRSLKMNGGSWKGLSLPVVRSSEEKHFHHLLKYLLSTQLTEEADPTFPVNEAGPTFPGNALTHERTSQPQQQQQQLLKKGQRRQPQDGAEKAMTGESAPESALSVGAVGGIQAGSMDAELSRPRAQSDSHHSLGPSASSSETSPSSKLSIDSSSGTAPGPPKPTNSQSHRHNNGTGKNTADANASSAPFKTPYQQSARSSVVFSQMYYIHVQSDQRRSTKISVSTEKDLQSKSESTSEPFDIFCNTTYTGSQMTFSFVCRRDFDDVFIGLTSRSQLDRKGASIPSMGWRGSSGARLYSAKPVGHASLDRNGDADARPRRLWGKGDCVELIVTMAPPSTASQSSSPPWLASRMVLKVNGSEIDAIEQLPPLRSWCWYLALHTGGDVSCVSFLRDSYSVFWGDYLVKRFT